MEISVGEPSRQIHSIEKTVQFGLLKNSSSHMNDTVPLANRIPAKGCTELKAAASQNGKYAYANPAQVSCPHPSLPHMLREARMSRIIFN